MLFAAPLPPIWVPRTRALTLGRSASCDLPIPKREASRRHAEVRFEGRQVVIEDLGSKNGTFVNGQRITTSTILRPGDRIWIGGIEITFCQVDERFDFSASMEDTVAIDLSQEAEPEVFRGDFQEISPSVVLQLLEGSRKSGALLVHAPEGEARLWVEHGEPVHAETPDAGGWAAAYWICGLRIGRFRFETDQPPPRRTIVGSMTELLLEASRRVDEGKAGRTYRMAR